MLVRYEGLIIGIQIDEDDVFVHVCLILIVGDGNIVAGNFSSEGSLKSVSGSVEKEASDLKFCVVDFEHRLGDGGRLVDMGKIKVDLVLGLDTLILFDID